MRWIGGPPDSGKTTVAALMAEILGGEMYRQDAHELRHIREADPERYPRHAAFRRRLEDHAQAAFFEWLWLGATPAAMAADARANWEERIGLVCADLVALPSDRVVVAEGPGFFPAVILPLLADPRQAVWLVSTEAFKRASHARRGKSAWRELVSDPERARRNHIERDLVMARMYRDDLDALGIPWIDVDGTVPPDRIADRIAGRFVTVPPG